MYILIFNKLDCEIFFRCIDHTKYFTFFKKKKKDKKLR